MRFNCPAPVNATMTSSGAAASSSTSSGDSSAFSMVVRRSSANSSAISCNSLRMTAKSFFSLCRMPSKRSMSFRMSSYSLRRAMISRFVSRCRRMSKIACACASDSSKRSIRRAFASFGFFEERISAMTSSRLSTAIISPCKMCARAFACFRSYSVRRVMTFSDGG